MQKLKRPELSRQLDWLLGNLLLPVKQLTERLVRLPRFLTMTALVVLFLLGFSMLSGCASPANRSLPAQLDPRPMPPFKGRTYRDAMFYVPELQEWGMSCEADKEATRKALSDD